MNTFKDFIETYVGVYTPTGTGLAEADWTFIAGAVVLIVLIIVFFRSVRFAFRRLTK